MIQLDDQSLRTVQEILRTTSLSRPYIFVIFGSRARGNAKQYSDIDLGIVSDTPASLLDIALLDEQFEQSNLPYKVEVVDLQRTNETFRRLARQDAQEVMV